MKKIVTLLLTATFFASCSTDAVSYDPPAQQSQVKVVEQVDFNDRSFALTYNSDHTLQSAVSENLSYFVSYSNGKIATVNGTSNGQPFSAEFTYDQENHLSVVTVNGVAQHATFNAQGNYYEVKQSPETLTRRVYRLTNDGDLRETVFYGSNGNQMNGEVFSYEATQRGPLYNANRVTLHLALACPNNALYACAFGAYHPFKKMATAHDGMVDLENTYDAEGFVAASTNEEENFAAFTYGNN